MAPVGGVDYPSSYAEFRSWFPDDEACLDYLDWLRWRDGWACPLCGCTVGWALSNGRRECAMEFPRFRGHLSVERVERSARGWCSCQPRIRSTSAERRLSCSEGAARRSLSSPPSLGSRRSHCATGAASSMSTKVALRA